MISDLLKNNIVVQIRINVNYIDDSVLKMLAKKKNNVEAVILISNYKFN